MQDFCTIIKDTTRGSTDKVVPAGTRVKVLAARLDDDGLKLLVHQRGKGGDFQVRADVTDYTEDKR